MEHILMGEYDIIVVGAGHAGCEAALASARMGNKTLMFSINLEAIAMMPCNPSIGGTGKGHLVREIDALGGEMGKNIDKTFIQSRMLNTAKGPAVHSLRAQADKHKYHVEMKKTIEKEPNLDVKQAEVVDLIVEDGKVWAYGSPWSGKTPCYKQERYELVGCVRLSQAPYNQIKQLSVLQAYGAIHPSCPPEFAYDSMLYDHVSEFISNLLSKVPFYHLACLPDEEAARLSC